MPKHGATCRCWQCVNAHAIMPSGGSLEKKIEGGQGGRAPTVICTCGDSPEPKPARLTAGLRLRRDRSNLWEATCLGCGVTWHIRRDQWGK